MCRIPEHTLGILPQIVNVSDTHNTQNKRGTPSALCACVQGWEGNLLHKNFTMRSI